MADNKSSLVQIAQATLDEATQSVKSVITVNGTVVDAANPLPVLIDSQSIVVEVGLDKANDSVQVAGTDGTTPRVLSTDATGKLNINNVSGTVSLPTGASTSANQTTIIGHLDGVEGLLTTIDADTGGILTAVQLLDDTVATDGSAALTKGLQIAGTDGTNAQIISTNVSGHVNIADGGNSITVDGTVTANAGTGNFTVIQPTAANLNATVTGTVAATQSGTWNITSITNALPAGTNNIGDVDILSVPAPLNVIGAGAAASALRVQLSDESLSALENISVTVTNSAVEITNDAGNPIPVNGTVTANIGTIAGVATETTLSAVNGKLPATLGQKAMTASLAVAIASDQSAVPASQSGTWNITNVSGTVSLPTGASTSANQSTIITSLQLIDDVITSDNTAIGTTKLAMVGGFDGTNAQYLSVTSAGAVNIADGGNSITVDGTVAATQSGTWTVNTQNVMDWRARARLVYTSTNVTTGAWVQLLASVGATAIREVEIFDSSGETLELGIGTAGSEVAKAYIFPGGNGRISLQIAASARVAIRAVSATANAGEIIVNFYG